jgi:type IV pilus assembly protein PilB
MTVFSRCVLGEAMLDAGILNSDQLKGILVEKQSTNKSLIKMLIEKGFVSEEKLLSVMEKQLSIPRVNLLNIRISPEIIKLLPVEMAQHYLVIPLKISGCQLLLAMADPFNLEAIDNVAMFTGFEVSPVLAGERSIIHAINHFYSISETHESDNPAEELTSGRENQPEDLQFLADQAPVVKVVNSLICRAIEEGASDIHFEPSDEGLRIRMRLDGTLKDLAAPSKQKQIHIISRIKIMANLDIAEKRLPQDGNIQLNNSGHQVNLRVSTMPTIHGEKIVIRFLEKERIVLPLEQLGFTENYHHIFMRLLLNQSGMILVTGPTGCGKTTTLYSALNYLNRSEDNIITIEDPVECRIRGINQIQINRRINRTFANTLRSILRQDPNIIMVGEIRDLETAKIASQAALTGHLVLSTLHTNNAAGAVIRLIDMGLEPYLVTASLIGVIAQRLIRQICPHCKEEYALSEEEKLFFCKYFLKEPPEILYRGAKCSYCNHTGYRGRISIQELLLLNQELQALIIEGATSVTLQEKAITQGMLPLVKDGLRCLEDGITTMSEVVRTTFSSLFDSESSGYTESSAFIAQLQRYRI